MLRGRWRSTALRFRLLRASNIKSWSDCDMDAERLDIWNGFPLAPHLDAAFGTGFLTIAEDGAVLISDQLPHSQRRLLGMDQALRLHNLTDRHRRYLPWHREKLFRSGPQ